MQNIQLHNPFSREMTSISNIFIDCYMPKANGEYVKLYLCLLRQAAECGCISLDVIADLFDYTEKDVRRGLQYWSDQGLLKLSFDPSGAINDISFLEPKRPADNACTEAAATAEQTASAAPSASGSRVSGKSLPKRSLSADRISDLQKNKDVQRILFIAESYLGKTLTPTEITSLLYYYDSLHFDADLIEYLIEYCISRGRKSFHYIDKVALGWAEAGIRTVQEAKENSSRYSQKYYSVLNALGIKDRGLVNADVAWIDHWFEDLHFTKEIILEACRRTIAQIQKPSFEYTNRILETWHKNGIHHLSEIQTLDDKHQQKTAAQKTSSKNNTKTAATHNRFNNFSQREYDFDQLESQLLNQ